VKTEPAGGGWWKATKPDATSFYDSRTRWEVGTTVAVPKDERRRVLCEAGLLHISDAPGETLRGGSWPCRLFAVEPAKVVAQEGHKAGCWEVRVLAELPAWQALGPNGQAVAALIDRAGRLTAEEVQALGAPRYAARAARAAARAARAAAWAAAWDAAWDAAQDAAWDAARDAPWGAARNAAWDAARSALALVVRDLISEADFELLYGPWRSVIGEN
jgi:hypothetical protein